MKDRCDKNKKKKPASQDASRTAPEMSMVAVSSKSEVESNHEIVMVSENEEQLCLLIEEAGLQGVIDSACSKTVAGIRYIISFLNALSAEMKNLIDDAEPSSTVFQFGGGDQRISSYKIHLPAQIGNMKINITTEVVDADIPLLIGANSLEKSKAVLDFGKLRAKFFSVEVPLTRVGTGHFCISIVEKTEVKVHGMSEVVLHSEVKNDLGPLN